jgi:hypothetical protein
MTYNSYPIGGWGLESYGQYDINDFRFQSTPLETARPPTAIVNYIVVTKEWNIGIASETDRHGFDRLPQKPVKLVENLSKIQILNLRMTKTSNRPVLPVYQPVWPINWYRKW